ncbi:hypothetical protein FRC10_009169 [Ceratobasidium sp. 414]|nr:hypothetical protein FRC10_009169 [Ceratobasidium sp. 414]
MAIDIQRLNGFVMDRILSEDPASHSIAILGTLPEVTKSDGETSRKRAPVIVQVVKTPIAASEISVVQGVFGKLETIGHNDIYHWILGWLQDDRPADVKITLVENATEAHIRKFTKQTFTMVRESPKLYVEVVKPYIDAFPPSRLQWVYNILSHESESDRIMYEDPSPSDGFVIVPDLKWDGKTMSTFYIQAIVHTRDVRSLRDIRKRHLPMLRNIRKHGIKVSQDKYGLTAGNLRFFIHYQPSYYHFHVHIVTLELSGQSNANVGMAHLLDDVISLLELESDGLPDDQGIFARIDMTYNIGTQHGLHDAVAARQVPLTD